MLKSSQFGWDGWTSAGLQSSVYPQLLILGTIYDCYVADGAKRKLMLFLKKGFCFFLFCVIAVTSCLLSFVCIFMSVTSCPVMFLYIINFVPIIGFHYFLLLFGCFLWLSACFTYFMSYLNLLTDLYMQCCIIDCFLSCVSSSCFCLSNAYLWIIVSCIT